MMIENKQTAVGYLVEALKEIGFSTNNILEFENEVQIANEMFKEQLYSFYIKGGVDAITKADRNVEDLYNETFKSE